MFFLRMISRSVARQFRRRVLICITVALAAAVSVAMLGIVYDVGDKLTAELSTYGSNITVRPKSDAVAAELYGSSSSNTPSSSPADPTSFIRESDLQKIKTIFWAYNITDFAPQLNIRMSVQSGKTAQKAGNVPVVGTWFNKPLHASTGETSVLGVQRMRPWWKLAGSWAKDSADQAMAGSALADRLGISAGDTVTLSKGSRTRQLTITGVYTSGDDDDNALYTSTALVQDLSGLPDSVDYVEVKALTTPENDLARKAAKNPDALSQEEWETWYCIPVVYRVSDRGGPPRGCG